MQLPLLLIVALASYHCLFFAGIDPHNTKRRPAGWLVIIKTLIVLLPVILILVGAVMNPRLLNFLATLSLSLLVIPCLNPPDYFREAEVPSKWKRVAYTIRSKISGGAIVKLACLMLSLLVSLVGGHWWFVVVCAVAPFLMILKAITANLLIQSEDGEFAGYSEQQRIKAMDEFAVIGRRGWAGCLVATSLVGYLLVVQCNLTPSNWYGVLAVASATWADALLDALAAW